MGAAPGGVAPAHEDGTYGAMQAFGGGTPLPATAQVRAGTHKHRTHVQIWSHTHTHTHTHTRARARTRKITRCLGNMLPSKSAPGERRRTLATQKPPACAARNQTKAPCCCRRGHFWLGTHGSDVCRPRSCLACVLHAVMPHSTRTRRSSRRTSAWMHLERVRTTLATRRSRRTILATVRTHISTPCFTCATGDCQRNTRPPFGGAVQHGVRGGCAWSPAHYACTACR